MQVVFKEASSRDDNELIFVDKFGSEYALFTDTRNKEVVGLTPDFWDSFYFCKKINIDYIEIDNKKVISNILTYKK